VFIDKALWESKHFCEFINRQEHHGSKVLQNCYTWRAREFWGLFIGLPNKTQDRKKAVFINPPIREILKKVSEIDLISVLCLILELFLSTVFPQTVVLEQSPSLLIYGSA
jgi:hypothetical protein